MPPKDNSNSKPPFSNEWDLPKLRASINFQDDWKDPENGEMIAHEFFDVKFYPYNPVGAPPVFAITSKKHVIICRINQSTDSNTNPVEVLKLIRDDDENAANCSCCWSKDLETGQPWLCIAGADAKVKVYDVKEGKLVKTLVGHGGGINDLITSPSSPYLIASCSDDTTVRIWSLLPIHASQPCMFILGGDAHTWDLLSISFHDTGRYLLSAGHDQTINLWTIPPCPKQHVDHPLVIHYPHFSTKEIHNSLVDCVSFFGDLILSRACWEETIVLWQISGFSTTTNPSPPAFRPSSSSSPQSSHSSHSSSPSPSHQPSSSSPPPDDDNDPSQNPYHEPELATAPTTFDPSKLTRSSFWPTSSLSPSTRPAYFTRLLQFKTPDCAGQFYMRFKVLHTPGKHPVLAFCNAKNKFMFWDLRRLGSWRGVLADVQELDGQDGGEGKKGKRKRSEGEQEGEGEGQEAQEEKGVEIPGWMPTKKIPRKQDVLSVSKTADGRLVDPKTTGRLWAGLSLSPDPDSLASGRPGSTSRPGSRGSTATHTTAVTTVTTNTTAAGTQAGTKPPGSTTGTTGASTGLLALGYTQKQIDDWTEQCDITDSHNSLKPHKAVMVDPKGWNFVGRQVAWSPEGDWCVVVGSSNRAMVFQRWGR